MCKLSINMGDWNKVMKEIIKYNIDIFDLC